MLVIGRYPHDVYWPSDQSLSQMALTTSAVCPENTALHIFPFWQSCGDHGFAIVDWMAVNPTYGTWDDIAKICSDRCVIVDGVFNHVGTAHRWFKSFVENPEAWTDVFYAYRQPVQWVPPPSPRGGSVLRTWATRRGEWQVWQTFTAHAVDINLRSPMVRKAIKEYLEYLASVGVWGVRLDALAYYDKGPGLDVRHNPGVHEIVSDICGFAKVAGLNVMPQVDCDQDGLCYLTNAGELGIPLWDFAFTVHLAQAFFSQRPDRLVRHLKKTFATGRSLFRTPRGHDGILLRSRTLDAIDQSAVMSLAQATGISVRVENDSPYELNCSLPYLYKKINECVESAATLDDMLELAIVLTATTGTHAYYYYPSLLGFVPESLEVDSDDDPRSLNRRVMPFDLHETLCNKRASRVRNILQQVAAINMATTGGDFTYTAEGHTLAIFSSASGLTALFNFDGRHGARVDIPEGMELCLHNSYNGDTLGPYGYLIAVSEALSTKQKTYMVGMDVLRGYTWH